MNRRVVVTGLGVVSSIGIGWREFWRNLLEGKSGISDVSSFDTSHHLTHRGGEVKHFRPEDFIDETTIAENNRSTHFAIAAAQLAVADSGVGADEISRRTIGVCMGTTLGSVQSCEIVNELLVIHKMKTAPAQLIRQIPTHSTPSAVARAFGFTGPVFMFSTACAAGNYAIGFGFDLIATGRADLIVAGGADPFSKVAFTGFNQFRAVAPDVCRPFDKNRKGMMVAEGAGVLILEPLESARSRGAPIYAEILGYGLSCDAGHMTHPSVSGIADCIEKALREANVAKEDIDYISAHGTGTPANDKAECVALNMVFGDRCRAIPVSSIKSMLGHTMGAASALEAIACVLAVKNDVIPPTVNFDTPDPDCDIDCVPNAARQRPVNIALNNSYAFGGNNAVLVIQKYHQGGTP